MENSEPQEDSQSPDEVFLTAVLFEIALGLIALVLGWWLGPDPRDLIPEFSLDNSVIESLRGLAAESWDWDSVRDWVGQSVTGGILLGLLAAIPMLILIEIVRRIPCEPVRELERLSDDGMMKTLLSLRPMEMIAISLCAGIGEELLFRGWLMYWLVDIYNALATATGGVPSSSTATWVALIVSSIAFGLVHPISKLYIILAAVMGLYFGGLVIWTGNLLVPITAHAAYDAVQMLMTSRAERLERDSETS
ncbi:CAAX amino terminal protease self- immunity [Rubripirellula obstinata]|uniref:CAAX amino terminal protease self-immunity n=1 Tax=Rubripirellula obstinata TaxID=406547 RepID=A0A5B1CLA0_9BACT|nr:CPBP family intramembrane glutamic endopeptidase [Rubripirellula obstinata]KAA1261306.1 CAAX amino terminal protease self- immunity [Rubripirellula obstinata]